MNQETYKFYIIELLQPPYTNAERYICAPRSWIKLPKTSNVPVEVKIPNKKLSKIKELAKKEECPDSGTSCVAVIKYSTNSYEDAIEYINILNKITLRQRSSSKKSNDVPSTSGKQICKSKTNETCSAPDIISDSKPVNNVQLNLTNTEIELCKSRNETETVEFSSISGEDFIEYSKIADNTISLLDQTTGDNCPNTNNCLERNSETSGNQKDEWLIKMTPESINHLKILGALRLALGDDYRNKLEDLHNHYERNCMTIKTLLLTFSQHCKTMRNMIELIDEITNHPDINDLTDIIEKLEITKRKDHENENNLDKVTGSEVKNDDQTEKDIEHNIDGTEVKNNQSKKLRGQSRKFTLPPEYNPNDSRWTLKHQQKKKNLVELLPHSKVYVNAINLANCKVKSKDCKTLARMLLQEIFSENALNICSLTGMKANAFYVEGSTVRPGLDEHARKILLTYVKKHARKQKWGKFNTPLILSVLRNKIQQIRSRQE